LWNNKSLTSATHILNSPLPPLILSDTNFLPNFLRHQFSPNFLRPRGDPLGHPGKIGAVAFSPDDQRALTGGADGTARLWSTSDGRLLGQPLRHGGAIEVVAFSPDGKAVLTASVDGTVRLWDSANGQLRGEPLRHGAAIKAVAFSPDGQMVLTGGTDGAARLWEADSGRPRGEPLRHEGWVRVVAFSPDGKSVLTGADAMARLWEADSGRPFGQTLWHGNGVRAAAFSPDGKTVLTGSADTTARLWDATNGRPRGGLLRHTGVVTVVAFSPDGQTALTGCTDLRARLWDVATGRLVGEPLRHQGKINAVAWSPDGKMILTGSDDTTARLWRIAELPDDLPRLAAWVEVLTGLAIDERESVHMLTTPEWLGRRHDLALLGGPPADETFGRHDPIHFGSDPTARVRSLVERGRWEAAEVAFQEALRARPDDAGFLAAEYGRSLLDHARPEMAATALAEAVGRSPDTLAIRLMHIWTLETAGDRAARRRACTDLVARFGSTTDPGIANDVAWSCALAPDALADPGTPVRLANLALAGYPETEKQVALTTLGAALYRAGRFEEAIRHLEESVRRQGVPEDWAFLAMTHQCLGHHEEALHWLDRLQARQFSGRPEHFWGELQGRILRREAEGVVLEDPIFPADPFAR
jgi:tetratricopeptide (TPR) repeat protein